MFEVWLMALHLILVHTPTGEEIHVNIDEISSVREPHDGGVSDLLTEGVHCVIGMTNGKFISTKEACKEVIEKLAKYNKYPEGGEP
jgi:uncharacterized protein YlzI (FlbEa/FlbD family)